MKKIEYLLFIIGVLTMVSCSKVEVPINDKEPYVNFYDSLNQYRQCLQSKTLNFYYLDNTITSDTVWFKIASIGSMPSKDYHVKIVECKSSYTLLPMKDAESGVHYVPFDDQNLQKLMVLHKGCFIDSVGIVVLRDKSLQEEGRRIVMRIADSDDIKSADHRLDTSEDVSFVALYIADCLSQPTKWDLWFFLGAYGTVKHDFIIRHSGKRWDDNFISNLNDNEKVYYLYKFRNELVEENAERVARGLPVLMEKDGTVVGFPQNY